jgi:outer membrane protein
MIGSKLPLAAALLGAALASGAVQAQATLKIGVVNVALLIRESSGATAVQAKLQEEFGPRQRDISAMEQKLKTQTETFQRDAPVMGEAERANLERQIRDGRRELERTQNEYLEDLNLRQNEELGRLQREVLEKAQAYARAQQYDLLLADPNVIFASTAVDITPAVLATMKPATPAPAAPAPSSR